eukprot:5924719-Pleurochrysis_carterae.AAC.3
MSWSDKNVGMRRGTGVRRADQRVHQHVDQRLDVYGQKRNEQDHHLPECTGQDEDLGRELCTNRGKRINLRWRCRCLGQFY